MNNWNTNFDPYEELLAAKHNIQELIKGLNQQSTYLRELAYQHEQLTKMFSEQSRRVHRLEIELETLKNS